MNSIPLYAKSSKEQTPLNQQEQLHPKQQPKISKKVNFNIILHVRKSKKTIQKEIHEPCSQTKSN